jgi:hypothetical protein
VVAVAFDGPPNVGPRPYRFMIRSVKDWYDPVGVQWERIPVRSRRRIVIPRGGYQTVRTVSAVRVTFLRLVDKGRRATVAQPFLDWMQ